MTSAEPIIVSEPGSSDSLVFVKQKSYIEGHEAWVADWEGWEPYRVSFLRDGYYRVSRHRDGWGAARPDHPILGKFADFLYENRMFAMQSCAEDFVMVARLHRWNEYMKNNEPPTC